MSHSGIKIPFVDNNKMYNVETMHRHAYQKYIALFLSKPELYKSVLTARPSEKQDEFFRAFNRFAVKYVNINYEKDFDGMVYFRSLSIDKAGSANICGGGGRMSNSARKQFLDEYRAGQEARAKYAGYLTAKYKIAVTNEKDERLFIGHKEPWKNPSPELLKKEGWEQIVCNSYDDERMNVVLPTNLEIAFIPLSIRNKVYQKWSNQIKPEIVFNMKKEIPVVANIVDPPSVKIDDELQNMMNEW